MDTATENCTAVLGSCSVLHGSRAGMKSPGYCEVGSPSRGSGLSKANFYYTNEGFFSCAKPLSASLLMSFRVHAAVRYSHRGVLIGPSFSLTKGDLVLCMRPNQQQQRMGSCSLVYSR
jgi:hypothetical protein